MSTLRHGQVLVDRDRIRGVVEKHGPGYFMAVTSPRPLGRDELEQVAKAGGWSAHGVVLNRVGSKLVAILWRHDSTFTPLAS